MARRTLGADGKDYRANSVHGPLPQISTQAPPSTGAWFGDCQPAIYQRGTTMNATSNPQAAADEARKIIATRNDEPRRLCARSNAEL